MGDPGFVGSLARDRSLRLYTADRALAFMGRPPLEPLLRAEVEAFLAVGRTRASVLVEEAVGNPAFVGRLRRGAEAPGGFDEPGEARMVRNANHNFRKIG